MVSRSVDETIERRADCAVQPIRPWSPPHHVLVEDDFSDTHLAELFLPPSGADRPDRHRGKLHALVTATTSFSALVERFGVLAEVWATDLHSCGL
jgi:hypothetical protein